MSLCAKSIEKPYLRLSSSGSSSQIQRCNRQWKYETEIVSIPSNIDLIDLVWYKDSANQTISYSDTRITIYKHYGNIIDSSLLPVWANHTRSITAAIQIQNAVPDDSGEYVVTAHFMGGLLSRNLSVTLTVLPCHISKSN